MALKTFNIDEATYSEYSEHCKKNGISMSKRVENFIKQELAAMSKVKNPVVKDVLEHEMRKYC